jgi:GxxExxY protein
MHADESHLNDISRFVVGRVFTVLNAPGVGLREQVYANALARKRRKAGFGVEQQRSLTISYDGIAAGEYVADRIVEQALLVELNAVTALNQAHHAQCIHYLKASGRRPGLLIDVGRKRLEIERVANTVSAAPSAQSAASPLAICVRCCLSRGIPAAGTPGAEPKRASERRPNPGLPLAANRR